MAWSCLSMYRSFYHIFYTNKECPPWHLPIPFSTASYQHSHDPADGSNLEMLSQKTFQVSVGGCKNRAAPVLSLPDTLQRRILGLEWKKELLKCGPSRREDKLTDRQDVLGQAWRPHTENTSSNFAASLNRSILYTWDWRSKPELIHTADDCVSREINFVHPFAVILQNICTLTLPHGHQRFSVMPWYVKS